MAYPPGYRATAQAWPRRNPQPPILQPKPLPPTQGMGAPAIGSPATKTGATGAQANAPLIVQPIIRVYHRIFG